MVTSLFQMMEFIERDVKLLLGGFLCVKCSTNADSVEGKVVLEGLELEPQILIFRLKPRVCVLGDQVVQQRSRDGVEGSVKKAIQYESAAWWER